MKKDIEKILEIPSEIEFKLDKNKVTVKKGEKELSREFKLDKIVLSFSEGKFKISCKNATRREAKLIGTIFAHVKNMIKGLQEGFVYKLEICSVHFPMNVKVDGDKVVIKSLLGETTERTAKILPGVNVEIKGNEITVSASNIESAGQTAANIEKATRFKGRDRRIFQDGIFIVEKNGRRI